MEAESAFVTTTDPEETTTLGEFEMEALREFVTTRLPEETTTDGELEMLAETWFVTTTEPLATTTLGELEMDALTWLVTTADPLETITLGELMTQAAVSRRLALSTTATPAPSVSMNCWTCCPPASWQVATTVLAGGVEFAEAVITMLDGIVIPWACASS